MSDLLDALKGFQREMARVMPLKEVPDPLPDHYYTHEYDLEDGLRCVVYLLDGKVIGVWRGYQS